MFAGMGNSRKGGIPTNKLRGITEADFFQKNNSVEKGYTFNFDGSLVDFKKPRIQRELEEQLDYEVGKGTIVSSMLGAKGKQK